jgi:FOG: TPR repeat, SEL1 subfamily
MRTRLDLLFFVLLSLLSINTKAQDLNYSYEGKKLFYNISSTTQKTLVVVKQKGENYLLFKDKLVIPSIIKHRGVTYTVTAIDNNTFANCGKLTSVILPSTLISIGSYAFENCKHITSISLPNSLISIGNHCFENCTGLTTMTFPSKLADIGTYAFSGCIGLSSIKALSLTPANIEDKAFYQIYKNTLIEVDCACVSAYRVAKGWNLFINIQCKLDTLLLNSAEKGDGEAQFKLGLYYENAMGGKSDLTKAVKWYNSAADKGNAKAQNNLGTMYYEGKGVTKDISTALSLYEKAANQGYYKAQMNAAMCYKNAAFEQKSYLKAADWYKKAIKNGNSLAKNKLNELYDNDYIPKDEATLMTDEAMVATLDVVESRHQEQVGQANKTVTKKATIKNKSKKASKTKK